MRDDKDTLHVPVMVEEVKHWLLAAQTRVIVDMTVGTGGHALALLKAAPLGCRLIGLDLDSDALAIAEKRLEEFEDRVTLKKSNFADVLDAIPADIAGGVDAILIDCGISKLEIVTSKRGFSFDRDDALDMRFDASGGTTAKTFVASASVEELTELFKEYGEKSHARKIAKTMVARRDHGRMESTLDLADAVKSVVRGRQASSLARVFLALRAAINRETQNLAAAIEAFPQVLSAGGRACVISYHSVEDRVVKTLFRRYSGKCVCPPCSVVCSCGMKQVFKVLTPRPLSPTPEEIENNPSARSAKLRVAEKM
ncbi:MAG: 16S rRNA (cytosine(1402)-N(4))-methyltransferase RsmH [Candidatus Eisenbacteria bacterium]